VPSVDEHTVRERAVANLNEPERGVQVTSIGERLIEVS